MLKLVIALAAAGVLRCSYVYGQIETCKSVVHLPTVPILAMLTIVMPKNLAGHLV